ncbi:hypothetical protein E3P84_02454 [Wallemia ichthyophaga]|nr:hypothetical protein E3P84_02454 [Wallemia ichthyophaga]TIB40596.1 hypothetical protein E3P83_02809 [Wallemia ichthyophaga]
MSTPLLQLKDRINKNIKINYKSDNGDYTDDITKAISIELDTLYPRNTPVKLTGYKDDEEYPLDTLIIAISLKHLPFIEYMKQSKHLAVGFISALDRKSVIDFLLSKSDKKRYTTNNQDKEKVKRIKLKEIELDDRLSSLRGHKPALFTNLQQSIAQKLQSYNKPSKPVSKPQLKPKNLSPIIILSSSPTSLLTMYNVKPFLSQATFIPSNIAKDMAKDNQQSVDDLITIYRSKPNEQTSKWYIINSVETLNKFGPDAWQRVVCVVTTGQLWQFKLYKWSNPRDLFRNVKGVYLHYSNESINSNIKDWNVSTFAVDKDKRHTDKSLVSNFWRQLDSWIATNKPFLTNIQIICNNNPATAHLSNGSLCIRIAHQIIEISPPLIQHALLDNIILAVRLRDLSALHLSFNDAHTAEEYYNALKSACIALKRPSIYNLPAFHRSSPPNPSSWSIYDPIDEFNRQGLADNKLWRITHMNKAYSLCPTYPAILVVPAKISDSVLNYASRYRSRQRIPTLTYMHWNNNATITRSAQPLVGLKNARSIQDEKLIETIFTSHVHVESASAYGSTPTNLIMDARPTTNAMAQLANGAGTENMDHYKQCKKVYLGIENIHIIRDSLGRVLDALGLSDPAGLRGGGGSSSSNSSSSTTIDHHLLRNTLQKSGYMKHIHAILAGTLTTVKNIHVHSSHVLVHCSDGWDRTSQVVSLAQICLDPFYRTKRGLAVLIEKDFVSFGHKFAERSGHHTHRPFYRTDEVSGEIERDREGEAANMHDKFSLFPGQSQSQSHKEISPVFLQFLDCLWQIQRQHPERFEYNDRFLLALLREVYSCTSGSFLADSERARRVPDPLDGMHRAPVVESTSAVWDYILDDSTREEFSNSSYNPTLDERSKGDMGVLLPSPAQIRWWTGLFGMQADCDTSTQDAAETVEKAADDPVLNASANVGKGGLGLKGDNGPSSGRKSSTGQLASYFDSWSKSGVSGVSAAAAAASATAPASSSKTNSTSTSTPSSNISTQSTHSTPSTSTHSFLSNPSKSPSLSSHTTSNTSMFSKFTKPMSGNMNVNMNMAGVANMARGLGTHVHTHVSNLGHFGAGLASEYANMESRFGGLRVGESDDGSGSGSESKSKTKQDDSLPPRLRAGGSRSGSTSASGRSTPTYTTNNTNVDTLFDQDDQDGPENQDESAAIPHKLKESLSVENVLGLGKEHDAHTQPQLQKASQSLSHLQNHPPSRIQAPRQAKQTQSQQKQKLENVQYTDSQQKQDPLGVKYM